MTVRNKYTLDGENYYSLTKIAKMTGKSRQLLSSRLDSGMTISEAVNKEVEKKGSQRSKETTVLGVTYPSFKDACDAHHIPEGTIQSRLKTMTLDEAFQYENVYDIGKINAKPEYLDGIKYRSRREACEAAHVNSKSVASYMKRKGVTLEKAVEYYRNKEK